jgi:transcription antitermination factor NusG
MLLGLRGPMVIERWAVGPVRGVLRPPGGDGRLGERAVATLARFGERAADCAARMISGAEYGVGDRVEIDRGPLAGMAGVVEAVGPRTARVVCALLAIGAVEARLDHLRLAS